MDKGQWRRSIIAALFCMVMLALLFEILDAGEIWEGIITFLKKLFG